MAEEKPRVGRPPLAEERMVQSVFSAPPAMLEKLERLKRRTGRSKSALIREALVDLFEHDEKGY